MSFFAAGSNNAKERFEMRWITKKGIPVNKTPIIDTGKVNPHAMFKVKSKMMVLRVTIANVGMRANR